jgi:hypothetical protein
MFMLPTIFHSYVFGPRWFYGYDSIIELIAAITCVLLVYYSYKCYKLTLERRYKYFSTAFLSLTLAFLSKVIGSLAIYSQKVRESPIAHAIDSSFSQVTIYSVNSLSFLSYIFFMTLGFMILFLIISRLTWDDKRVIIMLTYFVFISSWLGAIHYQLFYFTTFAMLCLIAYSYYDNHKKIKSKNSFLVAISFFILLVSHAFFVFVIYSKILYVIAEVVQLLGFLFLLMPFVLVFIKKPKNYKLVK